MPRSAMNRAHSAWPTRRERPGADQRHLPAQQVGADVERHLSALADEAGLAPGAHAAHRLPRAPAATTRRRATGARPGRAVSSRIASTTIVRRPPDRSPRRRRTPWRARAARRWCRARSRARPWPRRAASPTSPTGPWPKMAMVSPPCRSSRCSAPQAVPVPQEIAAPVVEGELVRQRHQRARRHLHVAGMRAVAGDAVDLGDALDAELRPAGRAVLADAAAAVVMLHHALADARLLLGARRRRRRPRRRTARARRSPARRLPEAERRPAPPAAR